MSQATTTDREVTMARTTVTTEQFLHMVRDLVIANALAEGRIDADEATKLSHVKLLYGLGDGTYRGVCHYSKWENGVGNVDIVEIAATAQESWVQLTGTVIHELGHVLAGWGAGHTTDWKATAARLGFTKHPAAAGQVYSLALFRPAIRLAVYELAAKIGDGRPTFATGAGLLTVLGLLGQGGRPRSIRPCSAGVGTKGGTSRGKGSGSRMRLWVCACTKVVRGKTEWAVKVRIASDTFAAHCDECGSAFRRGEAA